MFILARRSWRAGAIAQLMGIVWPDMARKQVLMVLQPKEWRSWNDNTCHGGFVQSVKPVIRSHVPMPFGRSAGLGRIHLMYL